MKKMESKETVVQWMLGRTIEYNGILQIKDIEKAMAMHNEQLSAAYTEGFKRCKYIEELSEGKLFFPGEETPDDFDTYYEKSYGEDQDRS
jgi:hypothetical protein